MTVRPERRRWLAASAILVVTMLVVPILTMFY